MNEVKKSGIKLIRVGNEIEVWIRCEMEESLTREGVNWCFRRESSCKAKRFSLM